MIANMDAIPIQNERVQFRDGTIIQTVIWQVPAPVPGSSHLFKYRLFFGFAGKRVIGYDNERGKGDHRHYGDKEEGYAFVDIDHLRIDFERDIAEWRAAHARHDHPGGAGYSTRGK